MNVPFLRQMARHSMWVAFALGCAAAATGAQTAPLTTLSQIHALTNAQASAGVPVSFEATVTYYRNYEYTLFVQDGDAAIYVQPGSVLQFSAGDRVLIQGRTKDSFRPIIVPSSIRLLRHGTLPKPVPATYSDMIQAKVDCRYVTARGIVRSAELVLSTGRPVTLLELLMNGGHADVTIDSADPSQLDGLLDAEVEVSGAEAGHFDGKMQQTGVLVHANSFNQVRILHKAAVDAWSLPATPMDEVLNTFSFQDNTQRVRVEGTLTYYYQDSMAVLQDGHRSIRVLTKEITPLRLGYRAEVSGFPFVDNGFLTLKLGSVRTKGPAPPMTPERFNWEDLASGKHAFDLVSIDGTVVTQVREQSQDVYMISSGGHLFPATLRHPYVYDANLNREPPPALVIPPGSSVRVTGVVQLENANPFAGAVGFVMLLRSESDVTVLAQPSWWTVEHLAFIALALLGLVLAAGGWLLMLNRKVRRQTSALTKSIEAEAATERRNAQLENQRSRILEQISLGEPLATILEHITELVSVRLNGCPCWCEVEGGARLGAFSAGADGIQVICREIPSRSGMPLGSLCAAVPKGDELGSHVQNGLIAGCRLAALAIETRALYSDLVHRSEFDLLTDVPNRFAFEKQLISMIAEARGNAQVLGLIYLDLDGFKQVNDECGHRAGDLYLQEVAVRMKRQLRTRDVLARLGGDEFAVLLPSVRNQAQVEEIALRLEHCFNDPFEIDGNTLKGSVSFGIAIYPTDGATGDILLRTADSAMYEAKRKKKTEGDPAAPLSPAGETA